MRRTPVDGPTEDVCWPFPSLPSRLGKCVDVRLDTSQPGNRKKRTCAALPEWSERPAALSHATNVQARPTQQLRGAAGNSWVVAVGVSDYTPQTVLARVFEPQRDVAQPGSAPEW